MPTATRAALTGVAVYLVLATAVSVWPRSPGVTRLLPVALTTGGERLHRVAEADGTTCASVAIDSRAAARVETLLTRTDCRQALRAAFVRDGDTIVVTLAALRLADPAEARTLAGQLRDLDPRVRGLVIDHRRLPDSVPHQVMAESTTGTAVTLAPREVGDWVLFATASSGPSPAPTTNTTLYRAARDVTDYFASTVSDQPG
ncbi:hypothetical protein [Longispora urticae]